MSAFLFAPWLLLLVIVPASVHAVDIPSVYGGLITQAGPPEPPPPVYGVQFPPTDAPPVDPPRLWDAPPTDQPPYDPPPNFFQDQPPLKQYNFPPEPPPALSPPLVEYKPSFGVLFQGIDFNVLMSNDTKLSQFKAKVTADFNALCLKLGYACSAYVKYLTPGSVNAIIEASLPLGTSSSSASATTTTIAALANNYYSAASNLPSGATGASTGSLSATGVPAPPSPPPAASGSASSNLALGLGLGIGLGVGAICLVIGVVVAVFMIGKRKSNAKVGDKGEASVQQVRPAAPNEVSMFPKSYPGDA